MIVALALAAACSGDCRAQNLFQTMERKLFSAQPLQLSVKSHADGAVKADATSELSVGPATRLHTRGSFMGTPFEKDYDVETTQDLKEAVILGLSRMGLLHNVVNVSQGNGIDRIQPDAVKFRRVKGGVAYALLIDGKQTSEVTLLIDSKQRPKSRKMVVHFPGGDMRVTETYSFPIVK